MAHTMFSNHGMSVDVFMNQRLGWFLRMVYASDEESNNERVYFIDELD